VWMVVLMAQHDELAESSHAVEFVMVLQAGETFLDGRVLLWLRRLCGNLIVAEGVKAYDRKLVRIESAWNDWSARGIVRGVLQFWSCVQGNTHGFALVRRCAGMVDIVVSLDQMN
jgi:hypothetical protein